MSGGTTYRIIRDQVGSPRIVVEANTGNVAETINYDEFGNIISDSAPGVLPVGFSGGMKDTDSGLLRFGARDYNPIVGRWTSKDPLRFQAGDANLYRYSLGDPINISDPRGLAVSLCHEPAHINFSQMGSLTAWMVSLADTNHYWIETDSTRPTVGPMPGQPEAYGVPMQQIDQRNVITNPVYQCVEIQDEDEQCIDDNFSPGTPAGNFTWPSNTCKHSSMTCCENAKLLTLTKAMLARVRDASAHEGMGAVDRVGSRSDPSTCGLRDNRQ